MSKKDKKKDADQPAKPKIYQVTKDLSLHDILNHEVPAEVSVLDIVRPTKLWGSMKQRGIRTTNKVKPMVVDFANKVIQIAIENMWDMLPKVSRGKNKGLPKRLTLKIDDFEKNQAWKKEETEKLSALFEEEEETATEESDDGQEIEHDVEEVGKNKFSCTWCAYDEDDPKTLELDKKKMLDHLKKEHEVEKPLLRDKKGKNVPFK